ncbi:VanZ family protein [Halomicroarcula sp. GCM10025817]|uniref:VanZ family protein n=1 Tax=Haloarcula TaxID=2237 RepID=UPI0023E862AD|nr:VanZ family protein [Halomicroarcula sp. SYNS111]
MTIRVPLLPRWLRWSFVVGIAGFIFYTSILAAPPSTAIDTLRFELIPLDKWRHFLAYGVLAGAILYAIVDWQLPIVRDASLVIGLAFLYGVGIEFGQSLIPNRYFSLGDAYANFLGTILVTPWYLVRRHVEFVEVRTWVAAFGFTTETQQK